MNNLYVRWCADNNRSRVEPYAFKWTAAVGGADYLAAFKGASRRWFVATTVDLLTTGVDVPSAQNVVFFKYVRSPIAFYQMVGRGTRIDAPTGKLMFRVYDYTNAARLFGEEFRTCARVTSKRRPLVTVAGEPDEDKREQVVQVHGFDASVQTAFRQTRGAR
jgi:type I restriction enzyme, R subunit